MLENVKFTAEELSIMSLFESMTGVSPVDCIVQDDVVLVVVKNEEFLNLVKTAALMQNRPSRGALRQLIGELEQYVKKRVTIIKYYPNPEAFLRNFFSLMAGEEIKIISRPDGTSHAIVYVNPRRKGAVIGRGGSRIKQARMLAKRYFNLQTIFVR